MKSKIILAVLTLVVMIGFSQNLVVDSIDFDNENFKWEVVYSGMKVSNDTIIEPSKFLISLDISKPKLDFTEKEYYYWVDLLEDQSKDLSANLFLYFYFDREASKYIDFTKEDWNDNYREFELMYWKAFLKTLCFPLK